MEELPGIVKILGQFGAPGVIAGLLFYFYRKDVRSYTELWQAQARLSHEQTQAMMLLVSQNSAAITANTEVIRSLESRIAERRSQVRGEREDHERRRGANT